MNYLNTCFLEGHLTADAENRKAGNGIITAFSIAQNRNYINSKNELVRETSFFNVEVWGEGFATKTTKYLTKGTPVRVQGRMKMDTWTDENGKKREKLIIVCEKIDFLPQVNSSNKNNSSEFTSGEIFNDEGEMMMCEEVETENGTVSVKQGKKKAV